MLLQKYSICPSCFDVREYIIGQELPNCTQCSAPARKMKYIPVNIHDTIFLNILRQLKINNVNNKR